MAFLVLLLAFQKTCSGALEFWSDRRQPGAKTSTAWEPETIASVAGSWKSAGGDLTEGLDLGDFVFDYNPLLEGDKGRLESMLQPGNGVDGVLNQQSGATDKSALLSRLQKRIDERTTLAGKLFRRRTRTLRNTASTIATVCAERLHCAEDALLSPAFSGGLPSSMARALTKCAARVGDYQAIMSGGALSAPDKQDAAMADAKMPQDEPQVEMMDSLLSPDERRRIVDETTRLTDSVQQALAQDDIWQLLTENEGVKVWRTRENIKEMANNAAKGTAGAEMGSDGATIRSEAILDASPREVYRLFMDNSRVHEYNDNCVDLYDIEYLDQHTKLNWCSTGKFGMFKPRDFVTVVHFNELDDGFVSVAANMEHDQLQPLPTHVRSEIQLAATFMQAIPEEPNKTRFVQMTQIGQLGGVADNPVAQRMAAKMAESAPIDFISKFRKALAGPPQPQPKKASVIEVKNLPFYKPQRHESLDV